MLLIRNIRTHYNPFPFFRLLSHCININNSSRCIHRARLTTATPYTLLPSNLPLRNMSTSTSSYPVLKEGLIPGTGVMGSSMCSHIIRSVSPAYPTIIYNRTKSKTDSVSSLGAKVVDSPEEVAAAADVLFTIVGYPSDVRQVYLGDGTSEHPGVLSVLPAGAIVVDMTTSEPSLAVEISHAAAAKGIFSIDAPVSGGDIGAKEARLSIMVGGAADVVNAVTPLLQAMGKNITHCGPAGAGQHTKMVNQTLIASNMVGVCEGLLYAHKAGLDLNTTISAIASGAAGSWSISNLGPRIIARNFDPGFFVEHFVKDLSIILAESKKMNLSLPGLSLAYSLYIALMAQGHSKLGTQSLFLALESLNGIKGTIGGKAGEAAEKRNK